MGLREPRVESGGQRVRAVTSPLLRIALVESRVPFSQLTEGDAQMSGRCGALHPPLAPESLVVLFLAASAAAGETTVLVLADPRVRVVQAPWARRAAVGAGLHASTTPRSTAGLSSDTGTRIITRPGCFPV
jgi:hypothetical protein